MKAKQIKLVITESFLKTPKKEILKDCEFWTSGKDIIISDRHQIRCFEDFKLVSVSADHLEFKAYDLYGNIKEVKIYIWI